MVNHDKCILDIGVGQHRKCIDVLKVSANFGPDYSSALLGIHCFTGEDCNASFRGKGKIPALKLMDKNPVYITTFSKLGDNWKVDDHVASMLEKFTCDLYGCHRYDKVNDARLFKLKSMCGTKGKITKKSTVDLHKLPPCFNSFLPHVLILLTHSLSLFYEMVKISDDFFKRR